MEQNEMLQSERNKSQMEFQREMFALRSKLEQMEVMQAEMARRVKGTLDTPLTIISCVIFLLYNHSVCSYLIKFSFKLKIFFLNLKMLGLCTIIFACIAEARSSSDSENSRSPSPKRSKTQDAGRRLPNISSEVRNAKKALWRQRSKSMVSFILDSLCVNELFNMKWRH